MSDKPVTMQDGVGRVELAPDTAARWGVELPSDPAKLKRIIEKEPEGTGGPMTNEELIAALEKRAEARLGQAHFCAAPQEKVALYAEVASFRESAARLRETEIERDNWKRLYEEESAEYAEVAGAGDVRAVQTVIGRLKRELAEARAIVQRAAELTHCKGVADMAGELISAHDQLARLQTDYSATRARCDEQAQRIEEFEADFRATVSGQCAPDERHCSCVPHLRRRIEELEKAVLLSPEGVRCISWRDDSTHGREVAPGVILRFTERDELAGVTLIMEMAARAALADTGKEG